MPWPLSIMEMSRAEKEAGNCRSTGHDLMKEPDFMSNF